MVFWGKKVAFSIRNGAEIWTLEKGRKCPVQCANGPSSQSVVMVVVIHQAFS